MCTMKKKKFEGALMHSPKNVLISQLDLKILYILGINSRLNNSSIAKCLNISKEKVNYRLNRLEKIGFLHGFMTVYDYQELGLFNYIFLIKLKNPVFKEGIINEFKKNDKITRLQHLGGRWDMLLTVSLSKKEDFDYIFDEIMVKKNNIDDYLLLEQVNEDYLSLGFLLSKEKREELSITSKNPSSFINEFSKPKKQIIKLEDIDYKILELIKLDARISLIELAKKTGLTAPGVKYKLKMLVEIGVIKHFSPMFSISDLNYQWHQVFLRFSGSNRANFLSYVRNHPNITWYEKYIGKWNFMISVFSEDNFKFNKIIDEIHNNFPENIISYEIVNIFGQLKFSPIFK
jgi:Lrp/AsnC family transcriptional regulator, leucine-responsive regulatory protein